VVEGRLCKAVDVNEKGVDVVGLVLLALCLKSKTSVMSLSSSPASPLLPSWPGKC